MKTRRNLKTTAMIGALLAATLAAIPARAEPLAEVPGDAVQNYLSEDMKKVPDGVYIPYPEEVEQFKNSPLYQFLDKLSPEKEFSPAPSGGGCPVDKKFLENV
ncbi:MAG: hypothetical protein KJ017_04665 [Alphaproteobacteria bacterium]|nr:hypothetical protein [Alphaproteobacteria bacterium]